MSMISALIDELNKSADEWNSSNMFELARMCREAADTIWQLRDDLQRTNAENVKLREERDMYRDLVEMMDHPDLNAQLQAENAKLRELVADMYRCSDPCNDCPHYNGSNDGFYCDLGVGWKAKRMRELGVEVDG